MGEVHKFYINGHEVVIDRDKIELVSKYNWYIQKRNNSNNKYVASGVFCNGRVTTILMHRLIVSAIEGETVDHINRITLDNRAENLRKCTTSQNLANSKKRRDSTSCYKGVSVKNQKSRICYIAKITKHGTAYHLGYFASEIEAAQAYNEAAKELHGEFANLNKF